MSNSVIVWRRLDEVGLEHCQLTSSDSGHRFSGTVIGVEGGRRHLIQYTVLCDQQWHARNALIRATIDGEVKELELQASPNGLWRLSGHLAQYLSGCQDIDLAFSPATNAIAIRRLGLAVGAAGPSRAVYVGFPEMTVSILGQTYQRRSEQTCQYQTDDGSFKTTLSVAANGLVISYPPFWERVA